MIIQDTTNDKKNEDIIKNGGISTIGGILSLEINEFDQIVEGTLFPERIREIEISESAIYTFLKMHNIQYGIDHNEVLRLLDDLRKDIKEPGKYVLARGDKKIDGLDEKCHFKVKLSEPNLKNLQSSDSQSLENLIKSHNFVDKGDLIGWKTGLAEGKPGIDVFGNEIHPNQGSVLELELGKGINSVESENKILFFAKRPGQVFFKNGRLDIIPLEIEENDLILFSGPLSYDGSLIVSGRIMGKHLLSVKGNLYVGQSLEGLDLKVGGSLIVKGPILGRRKSNIQCEGNIVCELVERAEIKAGGSFKVYNSIFNSDCYAREEIDLREEKGSIIGGVVSSSSSIYARQIGTKFGSPTLVRIVKDLTLKERIIEITKEIRNLENQMGTRDRLIFTFDKSNNQFTGANPKMEEYVKSLKKERDVDQKRIEELSNEKKILKQKEAGSVQNSITVIEKLYPGVKIIINEISAEIMKEMDACIITIGFHGKRLKIEEQQ